jgi:hypothetical protein
VQQSSLRPPGEAAASAPAVSGQKQQHQRKQQLAGCDGGGAEGGDITGDEYELCDCLKQSRKKVFRVKLKEARKSGTLRTEPGTVYADIRDRLMEFRETALERQNRVENEYQNLMKGTLKALQFLPLFESVTSEMDMCGVGLSERQLLLGYLRKIGIDYRREILKDRRLYSAPAGGPEVMRCAQTWREAHRILLEIEAISAGTKALVAAVGMHDQRDGS